MDLRAALSTPEGRRKIAPMLDRMTPEEIVALRYDWDLWARPEQLPPAGKWTTWLIMSGRGWGKTRTGAEWVRRRVEQGYQRIALVGRTAADVRDVMVEGESGLLAVCPPWLEPAYEPSKRRITFATGAIATTYSADEPDMLRGPQHDTAWVDELAAMRCADEVWANLMMGLRLSDDPRVVITTTPRPIKLLRRLMRDETTHVTRGSSLDNRANLPAAYFHEVISRYSGTSLWRQEIEGELLDEIPGALWTRQMLDQTRVPAAPDDLVEIAVGVDPAVTSGDESDETGIVVAGIDRRGHLYVLEDLSLRATPAAWAARAVEAYHRHSADRIVAEVNNGGDLVIGVIRQVDETVPVQRVTASRGKRTRAEPIAAIWEQGRGHIVGSMDRLEDQLVSWTPDSPESPDRMDAMVWAATAIGLRRREVRVLA